MKAAHTRITLPTTTVGLIYAGGYGTRLWPVSTKKDPKQVNSTFTGQPLVKDAYERAKKIFLEKNIFIVVTRNVYSKIFKLLGIPQEHYIIQPENADTAIAMGLAALYIECLRPGAVAVTVYSDQTISNIAAYKQAVRQGILAARKHKQLVTVGTIPEYANTHFGYIKLGKKTGPHLYRSHQFIEKPNANQAKELVASKNYVWNTGLYIWEVGHVLTLFKEHAPDLYETLVTLRMSFFGPRLERELSRLYPLVRHTSFDRAISERLKNLLVVVSRYHWEDIGNWNVIYERTKKDAHKNALLASHPERFITLDASKCLIKSDKKTIALIGVSNLYVIETADTLLICSPEAAAHIKDVAQQVE